MTPDSKVFLPMEMSLINNKKKQVLLPVKIMINVHRGFLRLKKLNTIKLKNKLFIIMHG